MKKNVFTLEDLKKLSNQSLFIGCFLGVKLTIAIEILIYLLKY